MKSLREFIVESGRKLLRAKVSVYFNKFINKKLKPSSNPHWMDIRDSIDFSDKYFKVFIMNADTGFRKRLVVSKEDQELVSTILANNWNETIMIQSYTYEDDGPAGLDEFKCDDLMLNKTTIKFCYIE